jgi:hypothetical protein
MKESEKIKAEISELLADRSELNRRISQLEVRLADAAAAESGLVAGDIVNVTYGNRTEQGIWMRMYARNGSARHEVRKIKKNGTASQLEIYTGYGATIEKV